MDKTITKTKTDNQLFIITAGSTYLDIDAYACCVAMRDLLVLQGKNAVAYSTAAHNYSVTPSLVKEGQILRELPCKDWEKNGAYIIVDVSDPEYLKASVSLENVVALYDHHVGFESYWENRIGERARIEFIGAAATLIYREWKNAGLQSKMTRTTAVLLIAAILDNTLNLTSSNTTQEDRQTFRELCRLADVGEEWCAAYFSEVQTGVEADLQNALLNDIKTIHETPVLPSKVAQICLWDPHSVLRRLPEIHQWFDSRWDSWMINVIDVQHKCSYFVCGDPCCQEKISHLFGVRFENDVAKTPVAYLRKQIIKKALCKS